MHNTTEQAILQLQAHIQALTAVLITNGITTESGINRLSQIALADLNKKK